jgi:hypothetical protein
VTVLPARNGTSSRRRTALAALAAATLLLAGTGCRHGDGGTTRREPGATQYLDRLSRAIGAVSAARARLATDASAIGAGAQKVDDVDDVAVDGDRSAVRARRPAAARAVGKAAPLARRYNKDVAAYDTAVTALDAAKSDGLDATQQQAVTGVVTAARAELTALHSYATVVASVWPRYEQLDENQKLWLARSSNGWYRDQHEAAGAYVVLSDRAGLDAARRSLAAADGRRLAAARTADAAVATARDALATLVR